MDTPYLPTKIVVILKSFVSGAHNVKNIFGYNKVTKKQVGKVLQLLITYILELSKSMEEHESSVLNFLNNLCTRNK